MISLTPWEAIRWGLVAAVGVIVAYTDVRHYRIFNWTTVPMMLVGLALFTLEQGLGGLLQGLKGLLGGGFILFVPFVLNLVKAGDVKLMAALGALGGFWFAIACVLYGSLLQGVVALLVLLKRRELRRAVSNIGFYLYQLFVLRRPGDFEAVTTGKLPHGVTLAAGAIVTLAFHFVWQTYFPFMLS